jgi:hypothetical protein
MWSRQIILGRREIAACNLREYGGSGLGTTGRKPHSRTPRSCSATWTETTPQAKAKPPFPAASAAVSAMHYTGMASASFLRAATPPDLSQRCEHLLAGDRNW